MTARLFSRFFLCVFLMSIATATIAPAQELGGAGTVQGTVKDPSGAVMTAVTVTIVNPVSGFRRETTTDEMGRFVFRNLPPNPYHVSAGAQGFETLEQDVDVRTAIPINVDLTLKLAGDDPDCAGSRPYRPSRSTSRRLTRMSTRVSSRSCPSRPGAD